MASFCKSKSLKRRGGEGGDNAMPSDHQSDVVVKMELEAEEQEQVEEEEDTMLVEMPPHPAAVELKEEAHDPVGEEKGEDASRRRREARSRVNAAEERRQQEL